jgi:cysteine desulfurase/selenocysteine lyase
MQTLEWASIRDHELRLTRRLLEGLTAVKGVRVLGPLDTQARRGAVAFSINGFSAEEVCRRLDEGGVALRGGYHCAQPLFRALNSDGAARASLALYTVPTDVDALLQGVQDLVQSRPRRRLGDPP